MLLPCGPNAGLSGWSSYRCPAHSNPWSAEYIMMHISAISDLSCSGHSVVSDSLRPHGLQHTRLPCPSPIPWACSNSSPSSQWCHPAILSSAIPFSSCLQSFPASGSFPMSQLFASGGQSIRVSASASASVLPMNIQGWFPLGLTGLILDVLSFSQTCFLGSSSLVWLLLLALCKHSWVNCLSRPAGLII